MRVLRILMRAPIRYGFVVLALGADAGGAAGDGATVGGGPPFSMQVFRMKSTKAGQSVSFALVMGPKSHSFNVGASVAAM